MTERRFTAFEDVRLLARGSVEAVLPAVRAAEQARPEARILIFDDATGQAEDFDLRGSPETAAREKPADRTPGRTAAPADATKPRGRGRPRLGVVSREVTLLPRHWDWLSGQPGGASAALRRLVEDARKARAPQDRARRARDAAYAFMSAMAGDMPGFEEAARALFAGDHEGLAARIADWPADVREHILTLAYGDPRPV